LKIEAVKESVTISAMDGTPSRKEKLLAVLAGFLVGLFLLVILLSQVPAVQDRLGWRVDFALTFLRGVVQPVRPLPTAMPQPTVFATEVAAAREVQPVPVKPTARLEPTAEPEQSASPTPAYTPTSVPGNVQLPVPAYEKQDLNNCGPATLAMHLRFYGWQGDQYTISSLIKPKREDRNVNVEEMAYYVNTQVPGLEVEYRVGGDIDLMRQLIAAGIPVTVEKGFIMEESYWFKDDRWAGHYVLLTGYDDTRGAFTAQDSFAGPNQIIPYDVLDASWKTFNRVYILAYPLEVRPLARSILGDHWDISYNREHALQQARQETEQDSTDSFAWFNLGTNLVYFERYSQAAAAYDQARSAGLPQRMLRYQFGPFFAYFHTGRIDDLIALTDYALERTPNAEEAMLWRGWALYRQGKKQDAVKWFSDALKARPGYTDAIYGLDFVRNH
jgi:tetratricopeptide (TPR) repeat protein